MVAWEFETGSFGLNYASEKYYILHYTILLANPKMFMAEHILHL